MIDIPEIQIGDLLGFADWVELNALLAWDGTLSLSEVADVLLDSGLYGAESSELFPGDEGAVDEEDLTRDDPAFRFVERIWNHLSIRKRSLNNLYPFDVDFDLLTRRQSTWSDALSFTQILLTAHTARYDRAVVVEDRDGTSFRQLFEKVVQAAVAGLFGGPSSRFGVPREPGWPTGVNDRVVRFAEELGLTVLRTPAHWTTGDRGLDVAVRLHVGGEPAGSLVFLTQCATGKHWKEKRGEPALAEWQDVLEWEGKIMKSVAVPWWMDGGRDYISYFRYFDGAVILDRRRLLAGNPDAFLSDDVKEMILGWCNQQIAQLPTLE